MKILLALFGILIVALVFSYSRTLGAWLLIIAVLGLLMTASKGKMI
jgi:hypothetical protein